MKKEFKGKVEGSRVIIKGEAAFVCGRSAQAVELLGDLELLMNYRTYPFHLYPLTVSLDAIQSTS